VEGNGGTPIAPRHRPTWLVVLSSLALIYGGLHLVWGLTWLRDPRAAVPHTPIARPLPPEQEVLIARLEAVATQVSSMHARAIRACAGGSLVLALALLYAAAAALTRDRHGRTITLAAAWLGITYQLATLPVTLTIARDRVRYGGPATIEVLAAASGVTADLPPEADEKIAIARSLAVVQQVVAASIGIASSVVLITYFGGRRGRLLYGLGGGAGGGGGGARALRGRR
jgi:hypothetical protein